MLSLSAEQREWLYQTPIDVMSLYGGMATNAFAVAGQERVLPVIIPAYNQGEVEDSHLPVTLASLAVASSASDRLIRPIVAINGLEDGPVPEICNAFGLQEDLQVLKFPFKGKLRTLQATVTRLLGEEGYHGPFATTDDDAIIPKSWPSAIMDHMAEHGTGAVGGGSIRYYRTPEVSSAILALRNAGCAFKENQTAHAKTLVAHGNNQWFSSGQDGLVLDAITNLDPTIGYGDDAAIVEAIRAAEGTVYPITLDRAARVAVAGNRSKTILDLVHTALGKGGMRYQTDAAWAGTVALR